MKRFHPFLPALPVCLLLLLLLWCYQAPPPSETDARSKLAVSTKSARAMAGKAFPGPLTPASAAGQAFLPREASDLKLPKRTDLRWQEPVSEPIFEEFRRWTAAPPAARAGADLQHGLELAKQRRGELQALIEKNPRRALELAVPHAVRQQLPEEIVALLEERVDAQGDLLVQSTSLDNDRGCMTTRSATLQDGKEFDVHTYGRRGAMPTRDNIAIHGIALDGKLALSEFPGRVLESSEVAARVEAGQSVSESQAQTDAADGPVIAFGDDRMIRYPDETQAVAALLQAEGAEQSGATAALASDLDGVIAASPLTEGQKTLLIIRVDFSDFPGQVVSDATLGQLIVDMNKVYTDMSSDKSSFALVGQGSAITPTVRMPRPSSDYAIWNLLDRVLNDARPAAAAAGYNYLNYTNEVVVFGATPVIAGTAGTANVGARGAWLYNSQWNLKTCAHEIGHNLGAPHSGAWDTDNGSVIGTGVVQAYGNVFDIMGVGPSPHSSRHFGASLKNYFDWVPDTDLVKITANGTTTTRIRAMDKKQADGNKRALVVERPNSSDDYWIEHRQLYGTNYGMQNGVLVNWASINGGYQQPLLLDMRPDTSEKTDAVLPIGKTFSDAAAGIHITPVARGTDLDGVNWIDVTTTRGSVAGNLKPVASISASNANPATGVSVNFTCTASDPNGDTLAYFWDWGNGTTTTTNSATASKSWPAASVYTVKCTVSDMKGLTTTANYAVQVGTATTFSIQGLVKTVQGAPLPGVVVTASPTTGSPASDTSDENGSYIITGLTAGNYTLAAPSATPDGFTNPVTVGPSLQDRNFLVFSSAYWTGQQSSEWSAAAITGSKNWVLDDIPADYTNDIPVVFDNTASRFIVDISGADVSPLSVAFNSGIYTLQGNYKIGGSAPITVASGATLKLGSSNVLPDGAGAGNVAVNGTLDLNGNSDIINALTGSGSVDNTLTATTSTLTVGANAGGTFPGTLKNTVGTLALTKIGNTDLILSGTNTYNGATTVNQNRLFISGTAAFSTNTAVTVNSGASFILNASGTPTFAQSIRLNSGSNLSLRQAATLSNVTLPTSGSVKLNNDDVATSAVTLSSANALSGALTVQVGGGTGAPGAVTLSGILSGSGGSLVKTGSGTLTLGGANTFTGGVAIKNGTLESKTTQTTLGSGTVTMDGSGSTGATFITGQNNSNPFVINAPDSGSVVIGANGAGSGFTMSGPVTLNGNLTFQTFDNTISGTTKATANLAGGVTGTGNLLLNNLGLAANTITISAATVNHTGSITLQGTGTGITTISAPIGANVTSVTQNSATSTLVLSGNNAYSGATTISAGMLRLGAANVIPDGSGKGDVAVAGTLDLNGFSETINGLSGAGTIDNTAANTPAVLTVSTGSVFSGTLQDTGANLSLVKAGNTDFTMAGNNTYSGGTTINAGRLFIGSATALPVGNAVTVNNASSLVLNVAASPTLAQSITLNSGSNLSARQAATLSNVTLPTSGSVILNNDDVATSAVTLSSANALSGALTVQVGGGATPGTVTLSGILSGSGGSLVKTGSGQLTLRGSNTFDGGVTIRNGTLESGTTQTTLGSGTVTMGGTGSTGATFITGQNNSNPFVINAPDSGSVVIGANGAGSGFTMSGPVTLNGNLTFQTFNNTISGTTIATSTLAGGVTGTGNLLLNNLGLAANTITISAATVNHTGSITLQGTGTGITTISAPIGANVTGITQNSSTSLMILGGVNTYAGNTTVSAGTLRLSQAPDPLNANTGNDASTVTIAATGATLDLTYTGTDKVDKLVIGSTPQPNGVYGRVGSTLPVIGIPQITGSGTLTVGVDGFSSWITGTFANGTVPSDKRGPQDDPDNDGISNLVEYAIAGQDPTVPNAAIGTFTAGGTLSFAKREGTSGLTYAIESSTLLTAGSWATLPKPPVVESAGAISYTFTPGTPVKNFARLKVTLSP